MFYLRHATLGDAWSECRTYFAAWLVLLPVWIVPGFLAESRAPRIPPSIGIVAVFAFFLWLLRGREVKVPFLSLWEWAGAVLVFGALVAATQTLPTWTVLAVWNTFIGVVIVMDRVAARGAENWERTYGSEREEF